MTNEIFSLVYSKLRKESYKVLDSPLACLAFFRVLDPHCQSLLSQFLTFSNFVFDKKDIDKLKLISTRDVKIRNEAKKFLKQLIMWRVVENTNDEIKLSADFRENLNAAMSGNFSDKQINSTGKKPVSCDKLIKGMHTQINELVLFLLGSKKLLIGNASKFLKKANVFVTKGSEVFLDSRVLNLLLMNKMHLIRFLLVEMLSTFDNTDLPFILNLLFRCCFLKPGERVELTVVTDKETEFLKLMHFFGLVCLEKNKFYAYPSLASVLEDVGEVFVDSEKSKKLVVESNFRIFCYNYTETDEKMLGSRLIRTDFRSAVQNEQRAYYLDYK